MSGPRLAIFGPVPPAPSGLAAYIAGLLPLLPEDWDIELFTDQDEPPREVAGRPVHLSAAWAERHAASPFDLDVYQVGNDAALMPVVSRALERPGLVVLHDVVLHPMRAEHYVAEKNMTNYRAALEADDPELGAAVADVVAAGLGGPGIYWNFPLSGDLLTASRHTLVHGDLLADCVRAEYAGARGRVSAAPLWLPVSDAGDAAVAAWRDRLGASANCPLLGTFGYLGPEHRVELILDALGELRAEQDFRLVVVGKIDESVQKAVPAALRDRVVFTGRVGDADYGALLRAVDLGINLRYPTARAASGPLAQLLSVGTPAVIHDLVHLRDIPAPAVLRVPTGSPDSERESLAARLRGWMTDPELRSAAASAARTHGADITGERLAAGWEAAVNAALEARSVAS